MERRMKISEKEKSKYPMQGVRRLYVIRTANDFDERKIRDIIHDQLVGNMDYVNSRIILNDYDTRLVVDKSETNLKNEVHLYVFDDSLTDPDIIIPGNITEALILNGGKIMNNKNIEYPYNLLEDIGIRDDVVCSDLLGSVEYVLYKLTDKERNIIYLYYRDRKTYNEIGKIYNLSGNRIGQILTKTLRKLRHPSQSKFLKIGVYGVLEEKQREYAEKVAELTEKILYFTLIAEKDNIKNCNFSVRTYNCLYAAGKKTLADIAKMSYAELTSIRNLGIKTLLEIADTLEEHGYDISHLRKEINNT